MLSLPKRVTHALANSCLAALSAQLPQAPQRVALDAQHLQEFDSSVLAVVLELRRVCLGLNKELVLTDAPERLLALARLYGVHALLVPTAPANAA